MSIVSETGGRRTLPVFATLLTAYSLFFNNLGLYARLIWFPFVLCSITGILGFSYLPAIDDPEAPIMSSIALIVAVASWISVIPAITAWHRFIILGQDHPNARIRYSFSRTEFAYLGVLFFVYVPYTIFVGVTYFAVSVWEGSLMLFAGSLGETVLVYLGSLGGLLAIAAILLLLPAAAVGRKTTVFDCYRWAYGNYFRLFAVYLLACAPEYLLTEMLDRIYPDEESIGVPVGYVIGMIAVIFTFFTITISTLSIAFKGLCPEETPTNSAKT